MSIFELELRIRTESSYEFSLGNSRSSNFPSKESMIVEGIEQGEKCYDIFNSGNKIAKNSSSLEKLLESCERFVNSSSRTEYIVMKEFESEDEGKDTELLSSQEKISENRKKLQTQTLSLYSKHIRNHAFSLSIPLHTLNILNSNKRCPLIPENDLINHAYGAMFGFVIGDSIGSYLVHQNVTEINQICNALEMKGGGRFSLIQGQGTDETELLLSLCDGLLGSGEENYGYGRDMIARKYLDWIESKPFDFPTLIAISFSEIRKQLREQSKDINAEFEIGEKLREFSRRNKNHESSLSLIRIIPLVLISIHNTEERLIFLIKEEMKFFTPNPLVVEVAIAYGLLLRETILKKDHLYAIHKISKWIYENGSEKLLGLLRLFEEGKHIEVTALNMNHVSVPFLMGLNEISKKEMSFIDCLLKTLIKGFNTDTNCSIVMGLVGAVIGFNEIPNYFSNKVINCTVEKSMKQRDKKYCSSRIVELVPKLIDRSLEYENKRHEL